MFFSEPILFCYALFTCGALLFLLIYYILTLSDLECDYLNAQQCCGKLNFWVIPKLALHGVLTLFLLLDGQFILFLINAPMVAWLVYEIYNLPGGNLGIYDPTEIHSRGILKAHLRNSMIYFGYYLVMFFIFLYCMISSLLEGDPIKRHEDDDIITEF